MNGSVKCETVLNLQCKGKEEYSEGWIAQNQNFVRASPLVAGGLGIFSVILNRSVAGVSPCMLEARQKKETVLR